jgi:hypothetical protein
MKRVISKLFRKTRGLLAAVIFFLVGFGSSMVMLHTYESYVLAETDSALLRGVAALALMTLSSYLLVHLLEDLAKIGE